MFIKLNGNVVNSVSIRKIDIEPFHLKPFQWRVWAHMTTEEKVSLGTFLTRGDAKLVLDHCIFPRLRNNEDCDLDEFYEDLKIDTGERVNVQMSDDERKAWYAEHMESSNESVQ